MNIETNDKYSVLKPQINFSTFYTEFENRLLDFKKRNLILDFSELSITLNELLKFESFSEVQMENGISFVVITKDICLDDIPDEIIVVPTFQEAIDMIEMDEMTRSLDF